MNQNSIPVTVTLGNQTVFSGSINVAKLMTIVSDSLSADISIHHHNSFPITKDQAHLLLKKIDPKSAEFLSAIARNNGEIDFKTMCKIFSIKDWTGYSGSFGKGITRALRFMTDNSSAKLVWWNDEEWTIDNDPNGSVYIDGQALKSLQAAIGMNATEAA